MRGLRGERAEHARDRRLLVGEGFFSGTATATHQSFFVTLLVELGVSHGALGWYVAFNGLLANVSGLAGGRVGARLPNRKALAALSGACGRLGFLAIAIVLLAQGASASITLLILIALASAALIGLGLPILTSMVADEVEPRERGAFFANRLLASSVGAVIIALGVAALLKRFSFPNGFTVAYLLATAAGLGSAIMIFSLRASPPPHLRPDGPSQASSQPISGQMWRFAAATLTLWFGAGMVGPILTPFLLDNLGASPAFIGLTSAVNALTALAVQRFWGRRVDRVGAYRVLRVSIVAVALLPMLYGLTPTYWLALGFEVVSGIGWAGYALGNLNFAMEVAPAEERARYAAVGNAAAGVGSFVGPLVAALLAIFLPARVVLLAAGGVRLLAFVVLRAARPAELPVVTPGLPLYDAARRVARVTFKRAGRGQNVDATHAPARSLVDVANDGAPPAPAIMTTLVLFDIDGTLLRAGDRDHGAAFTHAFERVYARPVTLEGVPLAGMLDANIARHLFEQHGLDRDAADARLADMMAAMGDRYVETLAGRDLRDRLLPGAAAAVRACHQCGWDVGVLTGNGEAVARAKLRAASLDELLSFGAYGDTAVERGHLVEAALAAAEAATGRRHVPARTVLVGDTPQDIAAARLGGACVLAVATGRFDTAALVDAGADAVMPDLSDTDSFVAQVERLTQQT